MMRRVDGGILLALGFSLGISLGIFFREAYFEMLLFCLIGAVALACSFFHVRRVLLFGIFFSAVAFGIFIAERELVWWERLNDFPLPVSGTGRIVSEQQEKSFFSETVFRFSSCDRDICPRADVLLKLPRTSVALPGDAISITCLLKRPKEILEMNGRSVSWRMYRASSGIGYECEPTYLEKQENEFSFLRELFLIKRSFIASLEREIFPQYMPLGAGMLLGAFDVPSSEKEIFMRTGLLHVTAVSGYNILVVGLAIFFCALFWGYFRPQASVIAIFGIVLYVFLVGAPASAVRAGIMGSALFCGFLVGRPRSGWRFLFFALAIMLFFSPLSIRYDIGLQLSFLATVGIFAYGILRARISYPRFWLAALFLEGMVMTFVVELFLLPLLVVQFGQFSLVSLFSNALLLPLVPIIMLLVFLSGIFGIAFPFLAFPFSWTASFFLALFFEGASFFSDFSFASIALPVSVSWIFVFLWYSGVAFFFFVFLSNRQKI